MKQPHSHTKLSKAALAFATACLANPKIHSAARDFADLQSRTEHPKGTFDDKKRFSLLLKCECCAGIRPPSAKWPNPENTHGRTALHVAHLAGIPQLVGTVRSLARVMKRDPRMRDLQYVRSVVVAHAAIQALLRPAPTSRSKSAAVRRRAVATPEMAEA